MAAYSFRGLLYQAIFIDTGYTMTDRNPTSLSAYIACLLLGTAGILGFHASAIGLECCVWFCGALGILGIICCFCAPASDLKIMASGQSFKTDTSTWIKYKPVVALFMAQGAVIGISFAFFSFLEMQSQLNIRLHAIETGYIFGLLQNNSIRLGLIPWIVSTVLGVGLAYLRVNLGKAPLFMRMLIRYQNKKTLHFIRTGMMNVTHIISIGLLVVIVSFAALWLCEIASMIFGWNSVFVMPMQTTFISVLIMLVFRKSNANFIVWRDRKNLSVGTTMLIYALIFSIIFLWLQGSAIKFGLGTSALEAGEQASKSLLAGDFSKDALENKIMYLIWGWWYLWMPWLASVVGRASLMCTPKRAFLQALIVPGCVFGWLLNRLSTHTWELVYEWFLQIPIQIAGILGLLIFIGINWRNAYTLEDMELGALSSVTTVRGHTSLNRWMIFFSLWFSCLIPGWLMLGWLPLQFIFSLGGFFMLLVATFFIGAWGTSLFHRVVLKKHRVPASL